MMELGVENGVQKGGKERGKEEVKQVRGKRPMIGSSLLFTSCFVLPQPLNINRHAISMVELALPRKFDPRT